ncbi:ATP-binding protein [Achromobacter sp. ACRQX]|uniref:ATP-binding protein n=1 Tax=Achromobacter sp. ACRQX TaxID=2918181 RepID=UPI001EF3BD07|nr:ATP-binding protein [Achromobacter sp. ACRQX]MCG7323843.1 ATP-binding protein [Achromobacter sp. ACRQX]
MIEKGVSAENLTGQSVIYNKPLTALIPGLSEKLKDPHKIIGPFSFVLYFLKRQKSDGVDSDVYLHRSFDSETRRRWLDNNSGIRVFRDNFRVRPYGEVGKAAWDWLGLGRRQAEDPSAPRSGRWRVTPANISGVVTISRIENPLLADKSSREGIQENDAFALFRQIIINIIKEFEEDRAAIYRELYHYSQEKKELPNDRDLAPKEEQQAEKIAQKIFEQFKKRPDAGKTESDTLALALLKEKARSREIDDRLEDMKKENSLLRVFASSGVTIASFTHELDGLNFKLGGRFDLLTNIFKEYLEKDEEARKRVLPFQDPFEKIVALRKDDERVKNWIKYSLRTIRKDKRKRTKISVPDYLRNLREEWSGTLIERQVHVNVDAPDETMSLRAYEIDLDCIFNNLIINSLDAFKRTGFDAEREILISANRVGPKLLLTYRDSGPGLSPSIRDPYDIFKPTFTTKVNSQGEEVGTGLGMWLVSKTVDEYGGKITYVKGKGFQLQMEI